MLFDPSLFEKGQNVRGNIDLSRASSGPRPADHRAKFVLHDCHRPRHCDRIYHFVIAMWSPKDAQSAA